MSKPVPSTPARTDLADQTLIVGIALTSFAALLLELALTRLFSVILFYHFAFLAISIALLGLGAGGVFAYLWKNWLNRRTTRSIAWSLCAANALVVFAVLEIVLHIPVSLEMSEGNLLRLTVIYLASAVPFFFTGLVFSVIFARETYRIPRLYGADLAGGSLACLGIVPLLNWLGGPNTILFSGLLMGLAAAVWAGRPRQRNLAFAVAGVLAVLVGMNLNGRMIDVIYAKGMLRDPSWVEFARWNAISRVEVDRQGPAKAVVIDADASTYIMNADLGKWEGSEWQKNLMSAPPAMANVLRPHGQFAIIGPGGGVDVLRAVAGGSPSVTGIEINPIIANTIMRGRYADYAFHLYERPEVHIHVTDGRSFLRASPQHFDVVQMTLVDTWASTAAGAFALSENNLYTLEAFKEYFEHLNPDGMIAITRWEFRQPREALRVVSQAMQALHQMGVHECASHFVVVSEGELDEDGIPVVVLAKKSPFTPEERQVVEKQLAAHPALEALYLPWTRTDNAFSDLIASGDGYAFSRNYAFDVSPVTDNAPFFFFTLKTSQLLHPDALSQGIDWKVNLGVAVLGIVLILSIMAVLAFLVIPLVAGARGPRQRVLPLLYFVAVGLGYIMVEIAFIQRFVLFLGHPTYALTVVVFLLLLSSGAGSLLSRRLKRSIPERIPLLVIVTVLLMYVFVLPKVLAALVGVGFAAKLGLSAVFLVPLGLAMGLPFPAGLRSFASAPAAEFPSQENNAVEWAWAMNASSSVMGSVLAMVIAIHFGLNVTLACGAAAYLLAGALAGTLAPGRA